MAQKFRSAGKSGQGWWFARVEVLVFLPSVSLVALWLGGENAVIATALLCPVIVALMSMRSHGAVMIDEPSDLAGGFASEVRALKVLDQILADQPVTGLTTACFVIVFDEIDRFAGRHGQHVTDRMIYRVGERLGAVLRGGDMVARLAGDVPAYAVILSPIRRFDLETAVQLSSRLQACISAAMVEGELTLHPSVSIGFCLAERSPAPLGRSILDAARIAADEALHHGPSAIRAFQPDLTRRRADRAAGRAWPPSTAAAAPSHRTGTPRARPIHRAGPRAACRRSAPRRWRRSRSRHPRPPSRCRHRPARDRNGPRRSPRRPRRTGKGRQE